MSARRIEPNHGTSSYRQALVSAMSLYLTAPFFRLWRGWMGDRGVAVGSDGLYPICTSRPC